MRTINRRRLCLALGTMGLGVGERARAAASAGEAELEERVLEVPGEKLARRCLLLVPKNGAAASRVLVLFHGLGETTSEAVGIRAWADRYGLLAAARRLAAPPVARTLTGVPLLTDERLAELNAELAQSPFRGLTVACPYTPNLFRQPAQALDRYASWVADGLLPEIRRQLGLAPRAGAVAVDGVSLGGYVSLEVFLRKPEAFAAVGTTQGAFGLNLADTYAARFEQALGRVGSRPVRLATSAWDKERPASERLAARLGARGIKATLTLAPGGHDQRFLCEVASVELLHHYDRTLPLAAVPGAK